MKVFKSVTREFSLFEVMEGKHVIWASEYVIIDLNDDLRLKNNEYVRTTTGTKGEMTVTINYLTK